jgi:hypothetical protein
VTSNISLIWAPLVQREVLCLRVSCSKAHNHALYVVKVSGVSPSSRGLLHGESGRGEKGTGETVAQVIEHVQAHYEVQAMEMGTLYRWCPESVVIECDCGQSFTVKGAAKVASCPRCGAEHREVARRLAGKLLTEEEAYRPTRREYEAWIKEEGSHRRRSERLYAGGLFSGLAAKDEMNRVLDVLYGS